MDYFKQSADALRRSDAWYHDPDESDQAAELRARIRKREAEEKADEEEDVERFDLE